MKKSLLLVSVLLLAINTFAVKHKKVDLDNVILEEPTNIKSQKEYKENENLLTSNISKDLDKKKTSKDSITIDGSVDFNKEEKSIDGAKINLWKSF